MPPFPAILANTSSPSLNTPQAPQPTALQFGNPGQNQWGPDSIGTLVFGCVMFFLGIVAVWQGRLRTLRREEENIDEEQARGNPVGGRVDEVAMVDLGGELGSDRVAAGVDERACEEEVNGKVPGKIIERGMRTGTEGTLVGDDDEDDEEKIGKGLED